jgi:ABC-type cobalamin/Fe3+-siderophores transport system ATPase subunit
VGGVAVSANVFELTDVHFAYRDTPALAGLTLSIPVGQRVVLLGANGSGKSTLLRLLDGLSFAQRGTVTAFGAPLTEERFVDDATAMAFRRRVGLVFQNPDLQLFNPTVSICSSARVSRTRICMCMPTERCIGITICTRMVSATPTRNSRKALSGC